MNPMTAIHAMTEGALDPVRRSAWAARAAAHGRQAWRAPDRIDRARSRGRAVPTRELLISKRAMMN
jgi:hypothetical protein